MLIDESTRKLPNSQLVRNLFLVRSVGSLTENRSFMKFTKNTVSNDLVLQPAGCVVLVTLANYTLWKDS